MCHKPVPYGVWGFEPYKPIQVGNAKTFLPLRDNEGDNISDLNPVYAENTAIYWIWRHSTADIVGQCQYRRRIVVPEGAFENHDAVVSKGLKLGGSVRFQYSLCHSKLDLDLAEKIIEKKYPEYFSAWKSVMDGDYLHYSNSFVMRRELYDDYCRFLFSFLAEFFAEKGVGVGEGLKTAVRAEIKAKKRNGARDLKYQLQIGGFLSERLFTVWLKKSVPDERVLEVPYVLMENTRI